MIPVLTREHGIDARTFSGTSHVFSLIYGHAAHALSLNDICDALSVHGAEFLRVRDAAPPKRNTFSNANRTRDPAMAEALYWKMLAHLLLRFLRYVSRWGRSFSRCAGIVRSALWLKTDLGELLRCYGTADGPHRPVLSAKRAVFARIRGFFQFACGTAWLTYPRKSGPFRNSPVKFQHTQFRVHRQLPQKPQ
jgi:hypothetical protein